jgi:hypothetical protein
MLKFETFDSSGDVAGIWNIEVREFFLIVAEDFLVLVFVDGLLEGLESAGSLNRSCRCPVVFNSDTRLPQPTV